MKIGLVGCGNWGRVILKDLKALGCEVHVVARSAASILRAQEGNADGIVPSLDRLPFVGGLVVATPTTTHAQVLEEALHMEAPIFVEKPLTVDGGSAIRLAAARRGRLFVMDKWRYHPGIEAIRDVARSGELGEVRALRTWRMGRSDRKSDTDAVWHLLPHDLSIVHEILGRYPAPLSARAKTKDDEAVELKAECEGGVEITVSNVHPRRKRRVRLFMKKGSATLWDPYDDHIELWIRKGRSAEFKDVKISTEMPVKRELRAFVEHLRGGPPPKSSADEGADAVVMIERIRRLAQLPT